MKRALLGVVVVLAGVGQTRAEDWPCFRGPTGQGVSSEKNLPTKWSATENVAWKTRVPGEGWSSPIVHGDRVFLTSTTERGTVCHVICLDRKNGKLLWDKEVFKQEPGPRRPKNSFATPTPIADDQRVYAVFSSGGIVALTHEGKIDWTNRDVKFYSIHGLGASPLLYRDLLIMTFDGTARDGQTGWKRPWDGAFLLALDRKTGKQVWKGKREKSRLSHVTPIVANVDGKDQIISPAGDAIQGFDPTDGKLLWTVYSQGEGVTPSPVLADGLVITSSGFEASTVRAVRLGGKGDVTKTHVAWEQKAGVPRLPSFVYVKPYVFSVSEQGVAMCRDAKTGKERWRERLNGRDFAASPVYADGRIYFLSEEGVTTIIEAGPKFKVLARNDLGERCLASMAVSRGQLFIRSKEHVFCIGKPQQ